MEKKSIVKIFTILLSSAFLFVQNISKISADRDYYPIEIDPNFMTFFSYWGGFGYNEYNTVFFHSTTESTTIRFDNVDIDFSKVNGNNDQFWIYEKNFPSQSVTPRFYFDPSSIGGELRGFAVANTVDFDYLMNVYDVPVLKITNYQHVSSYSADHSFRMTYDNTSGERVFYIGLMTKNKAVFRNNVHLFAENGESLNYVVNTASIGKLANDMWYSVVIKITNATPGVRVSMDFDNFTQREDIIPIGMGNISQISERYRWFFDIPTDFKKMISEIETINGRLTSLLSKMDYSNARLLEISQALNRETSENQSQKSTLDSQKTALQNNSDMVVNSLTTTTSDFNRDFENINTSSSLFVPKLIANSRFAVKLFDKLILNTPFESVLILSLTIGLALVIVGKVRASK